MIGECIECGSTDTELVDSETGNFEKVCHDCGYVGGPYTSDQIGGNSGSDPKSERDGPERSPATSSSDEKSHEDGEDSLDADRGTTTLDDF